MAVNTAGVAQRLAQRLRSLRLQGFANRVTRVTQADLAEALGASGPLISSWESRTSPTLPPQERLEAYATFFATERSVAKAPFRVLPESQLTSDERIRRDELLRELTGLRNGAHENEPSVAAINPFAGSHWRFPPDEDITIVCSALPDAHLRSMPYSDPSSPDYVQLYKYADLDALFALYGHLRAANPLSKVILRTPADLVPSDYTSHLVLLGGVDWNAITEELLYRLDLPVRQLGRESEAEPGGFLVGEGDDQRLFEPVLRKVNGREILVEDVAFFYRAPSPLNDRRTVTFCNGQYQHGTLGAVIALTDARFRDRNEQYLRTRFAGENTFSILSRVKVFLGSAVAPDWGSPDDLLHAWPAEV
jgi:transcriptional regulator with XRE-family HTH domain